MRKIEYTGEHPLIIAGIALGDGGRRNSANESVGGVTVERGKESTELEIIQEVGQSPVLYPGDTLVLPTGFKKLRHTDLDDPGEPQPKPKTTAKPVTAKPEEQN